MTDFTTSNVLGYGQTLEDTPENLLLNYIRNNWTLQNPPVHHPVDNPYGLMFGLGYFGYGDLVVYSELTSFQPISIALGGRLDYVEYYVDLHFTVRDYGIEQMGSTPRECQYIIDYIENFMDSNPTGLKDKGINYMSLRSNSHGNRQMYGIQVFVETFNILMVNGRINI